MAIARHLKLILAQVCVVAILASSAFAGGPLIIFDPATGTPFAYPGPVDVYTDLGAMGPLTNGEADALTAAGYGEWTGVPTSTLTATVAGDFSTVALPDIIGPNAGTVIGFFNGGGIHVIYDSDGSVLADFFGAPPGVLGISSPDFATPGTPDLLESWAVLNGDAVDLADVGGAGFGGVFTHEFGHSINLAHTQTNGAVGFFGDEDVPSGCPPAAYSGGLTFAGFETMYPFLDISPGSVGIDMATLNVLDDIAAVSNLYPAAGWPGSFGTITGKVFLPNGVTEVTGVNVVARNLADPFEDAISALSGDFTQGDLGPDGLFTLNGLTPGAEYVVYVDEIVAGGFSTTPTVPLPGAEEYHNATESFDDAIDDVCEALGIIAVAGSPLSADIIFNGDPDAIPLGDDDFAEVALPFGFPLCGTTYSSVFVGSNGFLTFGAGNTDFSESVAELLSGPPRIAALWDDLSPNQGGTIKAEEVFGDFVVSYTGVPQFDAGDLNTFSITLRSDGSYDVEYASIVITDGLVGRSTGGGATDPGETDLSTALTPIGVGSETVYELFSTDNDLDGSTLPFAPCEAAPPPMIVVTPPSLSETLPPDGSSVQALTISNTGGQVLNFTLFDQEGVPKPGIQLTATNNGLGSKGGVLRQTQQLQVNTAPALTEATRAKLDSEKQQAKMRKRSGQTRRSKTQPAQRAPLPHIYANTLLTEDFDSGFPATWSAIDNEGNGLIWSLASGFGEGNYTGGSGDAAGVSSDVFGMAEFDTEMRTPSISGFGPNTVLMFSANYQNFAFRDFLDVDISTDAGATWSNVLSWNEDHGAFRATPGEVVALVLDPFLSGATDFIVRWRYYDPLVDDWDWYAEIDDVVIVSDDPVTPCPWLSLSPTSGSVAPGGMTTVNATYDATGLTPGIYNCEIVINSNAENITKGDATSASQIIVPVQLTVAQGGACVSLDSPPNLIVGNGFGAGAVFDLTFCFTNCGSLVTTYDFNVSDSQGWCGPANGSVVLNPGATHCVTINCTVPGSATQGTTSIATINVTPEGEPQSGASGNVDIVVDAAIPVALEGFEAISSDEGVSLHWSLADGWRDELLDLRVQRADQAAGPYTDLDGTLQLADKMSFQDVDVELGRNYWYRLVMHSVDGASVSSPIRVTTSRVALRTQLLTPYEPTDGGPVQLRYSLAATGRARLDIYDVRGRLVRVIEQGSQRSGAYLRTWDRRDEAGNRRARGVYFINLTTDTRRVSQKLVLLR